MNSFTTKWQKYTVKWDYHFTCHMLPINVWTMSRWDIEGQERGIKKRESSGVITILDTDKEYLPWWKMNIAHFSYSSFNTSILACSILECHFSNIMEVIWFLSLTWAKKFFFDFDFFLTCQGLSLHQVSSSTKSLALVLNSVILLVSECKFWISSHTLL